MKCNTEARRGCEEGEGRCEKVGELEARTDRLGVLPRIPHMDILILTTTKISNVALSIHKRYNKPSWKLEEAGHIDLITSFRKASRHSLAAIEWCIRMVHSRSLKPV